MRLSYWRGTRRCTWVGVGGDVSTKLRFSFMRTTVRSLTRPVNEFGRNNKSTSGAEVFFPRTDHRAPRTTRVVELPEPESNERDPVLSIR